MEWGVLPHQGNLMDALWERSALSTSRKVKTPTLLIHGENDNDVPIAEAEQFYIALKDVGVETVMVRYPREGHGLARAEAHRGSHRAQRRLVREALRPGEAFELVPIRLRSHPQVRLDRLPTLGELLLRVLVRDRRHDDHVLAVLPVDGSRHLVLRGQLERIDHAQDLIEIATGARRDR